MNCRRILLKAIAGAAAAVMLPAWPEAPFPSHPILIVHGSKPGAPQDVMLRVLAKQMSAVLHQGVDVQGRPGGTGQAAMGYMIGQPAKGYTIFSDATGITSVLQLPGASFKWTQLQPVYRMQLDPFALYVKEGKYQSLKDFFAAAKSHPGSLRVGGYGVGSPHQITMLLLAQQAGVKITWVPFDSGSKAIAAAIGNNIDAAMSNISVYRSFKGKAHVLGVSSGERVKPFDDVPTFKEQGYDMVRYHWRGMFVKKGTPMPIVETLHKAVGEAVKSPDFQKYLKDTATLDGSMSLQEFEDLLQKQAKDDLVVLKQLGMVK
jgi:tripartite-type tricarboxylate transporter receptor subunit TctC